jgi:hypothetical protein
MKHLFIVGQGIHHSTARAPDLLIHHPAVSQRAEKELDTFSHIGGVGVLERRRLFYPDRVGGKIQGAESIRLTQQISDGGSGPQQSISK